MTMTMEKKKITVNTATNSRDKIHRENDVGIV